LSCRPALTSSAKSNHPSTLAQGDPERTKFLSSFAPNNAETDWMIIDFPVPVSPVMIFSPFSNLSSRVFIRAIFLILIIESISTLTPFQLMTQDLKKGCPGIFNDADFVLSSFDNNTILRFHFNADLSIQSQGYFTVR